MSGANDSWRDVSPERVPSFNRLLRMDRIRVARGRSEVELDVGDDHTNRRGVTHGGVVASLLDSALGAAVVAGIAAEEWCGTVQLNVQFLAPGRGPKLVGRGRMVKRGRRIAFARGEVVDARGDEIATAEGIWYVWPSHPDGVPEDDYRG